MERPCNQATLLQTLRAAKPGDVVRVSGTVQFAFEGLNYGGPGITIAAGQDVLVRGWSSLVKSSGITFRGIKISPPIEGKGAALGIAGGCSNITFDGCEFVSRGARDGDGAGLILRDSTNIVVKRCRFHDIGYGIGINRVNTLSVLDSEFRDIWGDAISGSSTNTSLERNYFTNFRAPKVHLDAMQFWGTGLPEAPSNIRIIDNRYERGDGTPAQFIFMTDSPLGYRRVVVKGNSAYGPSWHGCSIVGASDTLVEDNFFQGIVETGPGSQTITPWIQLKNSGANVVERNNIIAKNAKVGDRTALMAWLARHKGAAAAAKLGGPALAGLAAGAALSGTPSRRAAIAGLVAGALSLGGDNS